MPTMTEESKNRGAPQTAGSLLTAASALTILGSGGPDQPQNEGGHATSNAANDELWGKQSAPSIRSPSTEDEDNDDGAPSRKARSGQSDEDVPMTFPQRLMELLDNEQHSDVVAWLPHGKGFIIYQKKRFANEVLPSYFKQAKFTSFTRKLNRWGFQRVSRGAETGAYFHQYFQRGNPRLCMQMCCQSARGNAMPHSFGHRGHVGAMNHLSSAMTGVLLPPVPRSPHVAPMCMNNAMADLCLQSPNPMMNHMQQNAFNPAQISPSPGGMGDIGTMGMGMNISSGAPAMPSQMQGPSSTDPTSPAFDPTQSLMRLQELQKQQEQLLMQQKQIKEQMAAVAKTLPRLSSSPSPGVPPPPLTEQEPSQHNSQDKICQQQTIMQQSNSSPLHSSQTPVQSPAAQAQQQENNVNKQQQSASAYSQNVVNAAIHALQRSNTPGYLQMLMSSQGNLPKTENSCENSSQAFQKQLHASVRAQHTNLQQYRAAQQKNGYVKRPIWNRGLWWIPWTGYGNWTNARDGKPCCFRWYVTAAAGCCG
uniref:HSF-type DNA-binding domain-containing protein n=1 Tax=Odontella aurita TaxID=265563 RepID=A0A7S4JSM2_9STRA|mmetsp:Transcript_53028/g.158703  ORF Transcript_53028/g.158703 Transcript_53028/m.158703 type:complete len:534 (+) Transcript_53028:43-1644(+)